MLKRVHFRSPVLPFLLVAPQIAITLIFFIWPAAQALYFSVQRQDAFGLSVDFVGLENFVDLLDDPLYLNAFEVTVVFSLATAALSMGLALLLAAMADGALRARTTYQSLLIWPYAIAPAVAGILWLFMFNPTVGILAFVIQSFGVDWNYLLRGDQAMILVVIAAAWKQVSYNFLFFLAGLQSIPRSLLEAAALDGAGPAKRFWTIVFPLLSPPTFFLLVVNIRPEK